MKAATVQLIQRGDGTTVRRISFLTKEDIVDDPPTAAEGSRKSPRKLEKQSFKQRKAA